MKFLVAALFSVLGLISAYEFDDVAYNELLIDQLFSYPEHPRARRDTESNCVDIGSCCNEDPIKNYHSGDKDLMEQCYKELNISKSSFRGPLTEEQKQQLQCLAECLGKKKGYLNSDGDLLKDVLLNQIKKRFESVEWLAPKLDEMYRRCTTNGENGDNPQKKCNDIGLTVGHCIWKEIQLGCPVEKQSNKEKCTALQNYLKENKKFPPPPPLKC